MTVDEDGFTSVPKRRSRSRKAKGEGGAEEGSGTGGARAERTVYQPGEAKGGKEEQESVVLVREGRSRYQSMRLPL